MSLMAFDWQNGACQESKQRIAYMQSAMLYMFIDLGIQRNDFFADSAALIFEKLLSRRNSAFFSVSCMNGVKFGISKFCGRSSSMMTVIPYAGVFINNAVRALFIFPDTVTASLHCLLRSISLIRNKTYLVWLFPISCQALIRPVSNYLLKLLNSEK